MNNEDLILERLGFYADIDDEEIYKYLPIVRSAVKQIEKSLKFQPGNNVWDDRLIVLGALICYHHFCLLNGEGRAVSVGGVSVGASIHGIDASEKMMREQFAICSDLLKDENFLFRQVG